MRGEAQSAVTAATSLKPTKQVESLQPWLLQTLSYRVNGLDCMISAMPQAYHAKPALAGGKLLVPCTQRMSASDIIYTDSYSTPATATLHKDGIDVQVPTSVFLDESDATALTPAGMAAVLQRVEAEQRDSRAARPQPEHGGREAGRRHAGDPPGGDGEHGQGARDVVPGQRHQRRRLHRDQRGGQAHDRNRDKEVTKTATIPSIEKGQQKTVTTISGFESTTLQFDKAVPLKVLVTPVPGERTASNNSQTYQVIFSL